jgi:hypothetical protein
MLRAGLHRITESTRREKAGQCFANETAILNENKRCQSRAESSGLSGFPGDRGSLITVWLVGHEHTVAGNVDRSSVISKTNWRPNGSSILVQIAGGDPVAIRVARFELQKQGRFHFAIVQELSWRARRDSNS